MSGLFSDPRPAEDAQVIDGLCPFEEDCAEWLLVLERLLVPESARLGAEDVETD